MFKLNERGAALSGVFYGILLLFLFIVLGIVMVLGNGRNALKTAKENAINELNSKTLLLEGVVLDESNSNNGSYLTNSVDRNLLDVTINLSNENITEDTKTTILVTVYNSTKNIYTFNGLKYKDFSSGDIKNYPKLEDYEVDNNIIIDPDSYSSIMNATIGAYSTLTIPITFKYNDINNVTVNSIRANILFSFAK